MVVCTKGTGDFDPPEDHRADLDEKIEDDSYREADLLMSGLRCGSDEAETAFIEAVESEGEGLAEDLVGIFALTEIGAHRRAIERIQAITRRMASKAARKQVAARLGCTEPV